MEKDIERYEQAVRANPNDANAHGNLGVTYYMRGRYREAIKELNQCIRINPKFSHLAMTHYYLGGAYWGLNHYQEAIKAYKQSISLDSPKPGYLNAYHDLGLIYYKLKRYQEAIEAFKQTIRIDSDNSRAYCNLGEVYGKLKRWNEAVEAYKQAIRINPEQGWKDYNNLGKAYCKLGQYEEAIWSYNQAVRSNRDDAKAYDKLGKIYKKLGPLCWSKAIEVFKQLIHIDSNYAEAYCGLGIVYSNLKHWSKAIEAYKMATRIKPNYAEAYRNLAMAYDKLGHWNEAMEAYKQAVFFDPNYADTSVNHGTFGDYQEAAKGYKQAIQAIRIHLDYSDRHYKASIYDTRGYTTEAIKTYEQMIRINPKDTLACYNLATTYEELGHFCWGMVIVEFDQVIYIKPNDAKAHYDLGLAYLSFENPDSALNQYKILKNLDKDLANELFKLIDSSKTEKLEKKSPIQQPVQQTIIQETKNGVDEDTAKNFHRNPEAEAMFRRYKQLWASASKKYFWSFFLWLVLGWIMGGAIWLFGFIFIIVAFVCTFIYCAKGWEKAGKMERGEL